MSMSPANMPYTFNLVSLGGLSGTATGVGTTIMIPGGKKTIQVSLPTSATATIKVQNSLDGVTWFDVSSSTVATQGVAGGSFIGESESNAPRWRANITAYTTSTLALVAQIAIPQIP
mgnify:CR=1 FL=1